MNKDQKKISRYEFIPYMEALKRAAALVVNKFKRDDILINELSLEDQKFIEFLIPDLN